MRLDVLVSVSTACHTRGLPPGRDSAQTRRLLLVRCSVLPLNVRNTWPVVVSAPALDPHLPSPGLLALLRGRQPGGTSRCVFVDRNVSVREVVCGQVTPDVQEASSSPPTPKAGSAIFRYKPRAGHVAHTWCAVMWRMRGAPSRGACVVHRHVARRHVAHGWCTVTWCTVTWCTRGAPSQPYRRYRALPLRQAYTEPTACWGPWRSHCGPQNATSLCSLQREEAGLEAGPSAGLRSAAPSRPARAPPVTPLSFRLPPETRTGCDTPGRRDQGPVCVRITHTRVSQTRPSQ